jgi:hypothetical protein
LRELRKAVGMDALVWPPLLFDPDRSKRREKRVRSRVADVPKHEPRLLCAACRHIITYPIQRVSIQGKHEHCCTNPLGVSYHVGCYHEAAGCMSVGRGTLEFTWFGGYAWRIALCKNCGEHVGWRFDAVGDYFYALILDRLISEQAADDSSTSA